MVIGLFGIRLGIKRGAKQAVKAAQGAKDKATNARRFLTEEAWPEVLKNLEDLTDIITFAARMVVLLAALCAVLYIGLKLRDIILSTGIPAIIKAFVNWLCLLLFFTVFSVLLIVVYRLFMEAELYDYIVIFLKDFWAYDT